MSRPIVGSWAEQVYASLEPYTGQDEVLGWPLLIYLGAIGDSQFQVVDDLARDDGDRVGWSKIMDVNLCPAFALPWLGQLVGVVVDTTLSEANQRLQIAATAGWFRGTVAAMTAAAQLYLTGTKYAIVQERLGGDAYSIGIQTHTSETPADTTAMLVAIKAVTPAGMLLTLNIFIGQTWGQLKTHSPTWTAVHSDWGTWDGVRHG